MDPSLLHSFGWKPHTTPTEAMTRAAIDLHMAWQRGEDLTRPIGEPTLLKAAGGQARLEAIGD